MIFLALLVISGGDATTLHRDGVSWSIPIRLLLLPYDRRENSSVCIGESHFEFISVSVCAGKVVILTSCMSDVIDVAVLHVFYRPLSIPYVTPLETLHHLLVARKTVGCLTYHFLSIFWPILLGQQNHSHLHFCSQYDEGCAFICSLEDTHGRERKAARCCSDPCLDSVLDPAGADASRLPCESLICPVVLKIHCTSCAFKTGHCF